MCLHSCCAVLPLPSALLESVAAGRIKAQVGTWGQRDGAHYHSVI